MKKELLTKDKIIFDLESITKADFKSCFELIPFFIFLYIICLPIYCLLLLFLFKESLSLLDILFFTFIFWGINFIIFIKDLIIFISRKKAIKTENFEIITDWLTEKHLYSKKNFFFYNVIYEPFLQFGRSGKFLFSETIYYSWSSLFPFDIKALYRTSEINQDFYVIRFKNKKPFLIYNKKFFEMEEKSSP